MNPQIANEPIARNTGLTVCASAGILADQDSDTLMLVTPSDHRMDNELEYASDIALAAEKTLNARPWGHYETLSLGKRFQVKSIVVKPGGKLSLQSHVHRAEHWVVVEGTATVTIGDTQKLVGENQSVYIPLGEIHRLENMGKVPLQLIEVQTGTYLGEDDIIRYEDVYERA